MSPPNTHYFTIVVLVTLCSVYSRAEGDADDSYHRRLLPTNVYDGGYAVYNPDVYPSMCDFHFDYFCALLNRHECTPFTPPNTCGDCFEGYYPRPFASTYPENSLCFPECSYASTDSYNHVLGRYADYHVYEDKWAGASASDPIAHSARLKEFCTTLNREFKCPSRVCGPCKKGYINQFEISGLLNNEAACVPKCDIDFDCPSERPANDTECFPRGEVCKYKKDCPVIMGESINDNVVCKLAKDGSLGWQPTFPFEECTFCPEDRPPNDSKCFKLDEVCLYDKDCPSVKEGFVPDNVICASTGHALQWEPTVPVEECPPCALPFNEPRLGSINFQDSDSVLFGQGFDTPGKDIAVRSISLTLKEPSSGDANGLSVRFGICEEIDGGGDYKGCTCTDSETGAAAVNAPNPTTLDFDSPLHLSANKKYFLVFIAQDDDGGVKIFIDIGVDVVGGDEVLKSPDSIPDSSSCSEGYSAGSSDSINPLTFTLNICEE